MKNRAPPPANAAPISQSEVEIIRKKNLTAPSGPPPISLSSFTTPKVYPPKSNDSSSKYKNQNEDYNTKNYVEIDEDSRALSKRHPHEERDYDNVNVKSWKSKSDEDDFDDPQDDRMNESSIKADDKSARTSQNETTSGTSSYRDYYVSRNTSASTSDTNKQLFVATTRGFLDYEPLLRFTYRELKNFVLTPCGRGVTVRCYIERNRLGTNMFTPRYTLCADMENGTGRELIVCKKVFQSRTPHYIFSLKSEDLGKKRDQRSKFYIGKLRGISEDDYVLYDYGICETPDGTFPIEEDDKSHNNNNTNNNSNTISDNNDSGWATTSYRTNHEDKSLYRKELAVIHFNTKTRPAPKGIRATEICIPAISNDSDNALPYSLIQPFQKIRESGRQNNLYSKSCLILNERTSRYDPLSSCLADFKGRASMPSVKNAQFVESSPSDSGNVEFRADSDKEYILQIAKTSEDCFNMDFRYPLSMVQAFAIAIARFDAGLSW